MAGNPEKIENTHNVIITCMIVFYKNIFCNTRMNSNNHKVKCSETDANKFNKIHVKNVKAHYADFTPFEVLALRRPRRLDLPHTFFHCIH